MGFGVSVGFVISWASDQCFQASVPLSVMTGLPAPSLQVDVKV